MSKSYLFHNIRELATLAGVAAKDGRRVTVEDLNVISDAAMIISGGKVKWVGAKNDMPKTGSARPTRVNLQGATVVPGFVDCHTHLVFAGDRHDEFEMRNRGATYQDIAAKGGGIQSTVRATQTATVAELKKLGRERLHQLLRQGVTTVEIKSGYGLTLEAESKILSVAKSLNGPQRVVRTFLGPHAVPAGRSATEYLSECIRWLKEIKKNKLSDRVDIFVEKGFFSAEQGRSFLTAAETAGFKAATVHLDQLSRSGALREFLDLGVLSLDHLVHADDGDVEALARSETTAVLLPISDFYLKIDYPPARKMLDRGVRVALATDYNPGTAPSMDLSFLGVLARLHMKMRKEEVLSALTYGGASALGMQDEIGTLTPGKRADFAVLDAPLDQLFYEVGKHPVASVWVNGRREYLKKS